MRNLNQLTLLRVSNGALKADALPNRLKLFKWGSNPSIKGTYKVGEKTAAVLAANQEKSGFERVAIDFNHCTIAGSEEYVQGQPKAIFGYGRPSVVRGEGVFLEDITWTPLGVKEARNYEDLSPAGQFDQSQELEFVHSVALTSNGCLHGVTFFSAGRAPELRGFSRMVAGFAAENRLAAKPKVVRLAASTLKGRARMIAAFAAEAKQRS